MPPMDFKLEPQNLARHFNEALILSSLLRGPRHGYQLALDIEERSDGRFEFKHGTLYPILHKLEKEGIIEGAWSDEGKKGKRKRYQLTEAGGRYYRALIGSWESFMQSFFKLIKEESE